ncbi:isochorismatase family protein [Adlercreutzia sp. R7]|uniref:Isochorismatase family protein n=1 Tax=Adlercreutzia wanghongyangiae TaxID=3111451 RepID=A0ABU6IKK6_9ACTN|nr:isochorismatase family protein [Adlercreutzia sp. R7]
MIEPARAALIVIDMQQGFIDAASPLCIAGAAATIPACAQALAAARSLGMAVFHVRREYAEDGSDVEAVRYATWAEGGKPLSSAWPESLACPPELEPLPSETVVIKPSWSAFFGTGLHERLAAAGMRTVVLAGTTTPNCVRSTAYDAMALGYNVVVLADATSSRTPAVQEANLEDMAFVGCQIITAGTLAERGLETVRDIAGDATRAADRGRQSAEAVPEKQAMPVEPRSENATPALASIETVSTGWINKYLLHYTLPDGRPYTYEGVSRKGPERYEAALTALGAGEAPVPDAVCIVPVLPDGSVLLEREFRYPLNSWCISLPAGLIDAGESMEEAVARELAEETGYQLRSDVTSPVRPLPQPGFSSTGLAEENVHVVFAQVEPAGAAAPESAELIEPFVLPRAEIRAFLDANKTPIGTRCQLILEAMVL